MEEEIIIRDATVNDIESLLSVYAPYVENTAVLLSMRFTQLMNLGAALKRLQRNIRIFWQKTLMEKC